ncbi:MAG: N-6 DNA methylase [Firmicutes bacterium]|nr:N-6 DNA methylase [Bacillota bacterium]
MAYLNDNERSTVIDLISDVNQFLSSIDISIRKLGGESSLHTGQKNRKFPDVILYGDEIRKTVLQTWEIKMPDVSIIDQEFVADAKSKANILGLNSFFIWNFSFGKLYIKENDDFIVIKQWSIPSIKNREDVNINKGNWLSILKSIILEINDYILSGHINKVSKELLLSENIPLDIIEDHKITQGAFLLLKANSDIVFRSFISQWWLSMKADFQNDEDNPYNAYAKIQILKWTNRILFAHIIKHKFEAARSIDTITYETSAEYLSDIFKQISSKIDFYSIFMIEHSESILSPECLLDLISFSMFVGDSDEILLDHSVFHQIMEKTINASKRAIGGQFATPGFLAKFLVKISLSDINADAIDTCVGTGTIIKEVFNTKRESNVVPYKSIWASDKYSIPLQLTHMSIIKDLDDRNPIKVFQCNVFNLNVGDVIQIIDPNDGGTVSYSIPFFDTIVSNLPFVPFELISDDEKQSIDSLIKQIELETGTKLSQKSDLYTFIIFKLRSLISEKGRIGVITSNSWLGTDWGRNFYKTLNYYFNVENVIISGKGRWFQNADIVTTIFILTKRNDHSTATNSSFVIIKDKLSTIVEKTEIFDQVSNNIVLKSNIDNDYLKTSIYSYPLIEIISSMGVSFNTLFHGVTWLQQLFSKLIPITTKFKIARGSRRGWNDMFYPVHPSFASEDEYLVPALKNPRNLKSFDAETDVVAFCCNATPDELFQKGHIKAQKWIEHFSQVTNEKGVLLPIVLKKSDASLWYAMEDNEKAVMTTILNPNRRLFVSRFSQPTFIDQRFISINPITDMKNSEVELNHALLNSLVGMFYIEAVGFGRGLGVLDINSKSFSNILMLNCDLLTTEQKDNIVQHFKVLKLRQPLDLDEELRSEDRLAFDQVVFEAFDIARFYESIKSSLLSMHTTRLSVIEK